MQGIYTAVRLALSLVANSMLEAIPSDIDNCFLNYRIVVTFSGKNDAVELITSEILDSDWKIIDNTVTKDFEQHVQKMIVTRNIDYKYSINQLNEIMNDRRW